WRRRSPGNLRGRCEVEHELAGNWFQQPSFMAEGYPVSGGQRPGLEQRILHARGLFLHSVERLADHRRAYFARAQIAYFFYLEEIEERVLFRGGYQSGSFPTCQLARREPKYTKQVRSTVSVHGSKKLPPTLSGTLLEWAIGN